jgi:alpha/beta superfamily hydrolase
MAPAKGPSSILLIVVMMATMLNHNHAFGAMIAPAAIMVLVATHFDTHAASVVVAMHFAPVPITAVVITSDADSKLFGARDGGSSNSNSC